MVAKVISYYSQLVQETVSSHVKSTDLAQEIRDIQQKEPESDPIYAIAAEILDQCALVVDQNAEIKRVISKLGCKVPFNKGFFIQKVYGQIEKAVQS